MVKNVDFSNVLEWVDKPVWVVTKIRKKSERGGRVYQASKTEFGIYPGVIREIVIRKGYVSRETNDIPQALATVIVQRFLTSSGFVGHMKVCTTTKATLANI